MTARIQIRITRVVAPDAIAKQVEVHMRNLGKAMAHRAQRLVPKKTWALHDTIATSTDRDGAVVTTKLVAGGINGVDYALHVEHGTSKMRAQPYLRPALYQTKNSDLNYKGAGAMSHGEIEEIRAAKRESSRERRNARRRAAYIGSANR